MYLFQQTQFKKVLTLATTFHKPSGEENPCIRFGYGPLTIFNHTQVQVAVSMNAYPINMMHTSQQSTKEGFNKELERYFISRKLIPQIKIFDG